MAHDPTSGVSRGPCEPDFYCGLFHYLNWTRILTADFSVYLTCRTDFDNGLFRFPNLDSPILTTDFTFDMGRTAGATVRQGMLTPPWHLIPPLVYTEVRVRLFSDLYFLWDLWDRLLFVIFVILLVYMIMDVAHHRLFDPPRIIDECELKKPRKFLHLKYDNKGIDDVNINNILNNKNVQSCIPPYFKMKSTPCISYR